jgi:LysM repeat protein
MSYDINSNIKSKTGYSAQQLAAAERAIRGDHGYSADAFQAMVNAENSHGINSLFTLAHADIESAHGTSYYARTRNNLFGFNAIDSDPNQASTYPSQAGSIDFYANFLDKYYLTPGGAYYNGATPHGVFVKYSSSHDSEAQSVVGLMNALEGKITGNPTPASSVQPASPAPPPASGTYTVHRGDTMSGIAASYGISLGQLEQLNPSAGHPAGNFNNIWPGDILRVTGGAPQAPSASYYTVQKGDNLSVIASRNGLSLGQIEALNPHAGHPAGHFDNIWPGDPIRIR